jgi:hypothetical protein
MLFVLGIVARIAIVVGTALVVGKTMPTMTNTACRFVFLFALGLAFSFLLNYSDVRLLGRHSTGWTWASITALAFGIWGTFWPPEPDKSSSP